MERESLGRVRAAMSAVDTELERSIATLQALAASEHLDNGDLRAFNAEARRVLATQRDWSTRTRLAFQAAADGCQLALRRHRTVQRR